MPKQVNISPEVACVLERATVEGSEDRPVVKLPPDHLDRALYVDVDKVLKALGGKWDRKAGGHVFARPVEGQLAEALASGTAIDQMRTQEQFFTPPAVAVRLADLIDLQPSDLVLEPSAGAGALVKAALTRGCRVIAIEKDSLWVGAGGGDGQGGLMDLATLGGDQLRVHCGDFLTDFEPAHFAVDAVLMNPPFSRGQDMAHVTHAFGFLRPGGRLAAIMSPHWRFAEDRQSLGFRAMMNQLTYSWTPLPDGSFKQSGTTVNCGILVAHKGK